MNKPALSVSEMTQIIKNTLEGSFPAVCVIGEVSNYRPAGSGHIYFSLKDSKSVIGAVLFRGRSQGISTRISDGMKIIVRGTINVYAPRGSYQIIVEGIEESGTGVLLEALEKRKRTLAKEGLFDQERKKALPLYPRWVSVISSSTGAALQDILKVLQRRSAAPRITVLPVPVQGEKAGEIIASRIHMANAFRIGEVIILARGGGSVEDLMAFNEEGVVRAIDDSKLPVIAGIGHEIDTTLADLAADVRAATPSAAAELVSDRTEDILLRIQGFRERGREYLSARLEEQRQWTSKKGSEALTNYVRARMEENMRRNDEAVGQLGRAISERLESFRNRLKMESRSLRIASPRALMLRGYARVTSSGKTVKDSAVLNPGDDIQIDFADSRAKARILSIETKEVQP